MFLASPQAQTPRPVTAEGAGPKTPSGSWGTAPGGNPSLMRTQIFGSGKASEGAGAGGAQAAGAQGTTQTFGAVGGAHDAVSGQGGTQTSGTHGATQTFGAVGSQGAASTEGAGAYGSTQTFGAVGTPGMTQASSGAHGSTQTFGAVGAPGMTQASAGAHGSTQTFGAVPPSAPAPATPGSSIFPGHTGGSPRQTTQVFGAATSGPPPSPPSIAPVTLGASGTSGSSPSTSASITPPGAPAPIGRTLTYGAVSDSAGAGPIPELPPESSTSLYGEAPSSTDLFGAANNSGAPVNRKTSLYGAATGSGSHGVNLPPMELPGLGALGAAGGPGPSAPEPAYRRGGVSLPPELLSANRESAAIDASAPSSSSSRLWLGLVVAAGVLLAGVLAYPAWKNRDADMPATAVTEKERASVLLRRDDSASRDQAIQSLKALTATHPKYTEAQAELVVALSLRLGELQAEAERLRTQGELLQRDIDNLAAAQATVDWESRVNALKAQREDVIKLGGPLRIEIDRLRKEVDVLAEALEAAPEVEPTSALAARVKARALHAGVTAAPDALALAERLRNVEGAPKAWSTVARAEYVLSSGSPPDSVAQSVSELEALRQADGTLLRPYVLGARLALRQKDPAAARSLLDDVLALNKNHELARKLLEQVSASAPQP
ncbi:hypothetical protein MFUL124B02_24285 [Myxococcus fulvus 124B02]|nr:hypothetical protein MFUL124B02_24285 [Myxococcus fulvus 124B02]